MDFLKEILGEDLFSQFKTAVDGYNAKPENKDKQIEIDNVSTGYVKQDVYDTLEKSKKSIEENYNTAKKTLKDFECVDVAELKGQIETLNTTLKENDKKHAEELAGIQFNNSVKDAITAAGGKNAKAIMACMDIDTLKASKNLDTDLKAAIETCKKENDYLFGSTEPINNPVSRTDGITPPAGSDAYMSQIDAIMGISENK